MEIELQLGDVIQLTNPVNEILNGQTFIIDYIDKSKAYLINTDTLSRLKLTIGEDGTLGDGHITQIDLLSRADSPSYAVQNGLVTGQWVNIFFGGDFPVILSGEITNLEKDMIELTTIDGDILYINFDYKGIPENLPIEHIELRDKPPAPQKTVVIDANDPEGIGPRAVTDVAVEELERQELDGDIEELERQEPAVQEMVPAEKIEFAIPAQNVKDQLREFLVKADQIVFGDEELGPIVQYIDVSGKSQRYSIETQVADMLDDLLSTVPNEQRTPRVLNNIHLAIERFKQLREAFSSFDQYGNVDGMVVKEATYKPLKNWLQKFNHNLYWILPVVKNVRKMYDVPVNDEENNDVLNLEFEGDMNSIQELVERYRSDNLPSESVKYASFNQEIDPYFTPFNPVDDEQQGGVILEQEVATNLNTVIDNLEDMYASVFTRNNVRNRRFVISRYNLGATRLHATDFRGPSMTTVRVPMTRNDLLSVKSILTLPEPVIRFSRVNLPGSDILSKANLNQVFLNYWQLLRKKTHVNTTFVDSLDTQLQFDTDTFVSGVRNFVLNLPEDALRGQSRAHIYGEFANIIVPKTRMIFRLMKKYIKGKLSIIDVVSYLEPFMIYTDDLTFRQYVEITEFIDAKVSEYNRNMVEMSRIFKILATIKTVAPLKSKALSVVEAIASDARYDVFEQSYGLEQLDTYSNSEILKRMTTKDYARVYSTRIALDNLKLMFPQDIGDLLTAEKKQLDGKLNKEEKGDKCATITIAKFYTSIEQLNQDNGKPIYFDRKYDKTYYGILEDAKGYAKEVLSLPPEKLKEHIALDQKKRNKLSDADAEYLAETLVNGIKRVIDGQYAILFKGHSTGGDNFVQEESDYYVRKNDTWVLDKELIKTNLITDEPSILCNLQDKCIMKDDACESMDTSELSLQNSLLKDILNEFDSKYKMSKDEFEAHIREKYNYFLSIMPIVSKIETNEKMKYNNVYFKIGLELENENADKLTRVVQSPFAGLLDIILGQADFVKKQHDILRFCDKFTRSPLLGSGADENEHWLYCVKTGVKLIPSFKKELASAFVRSEYFYNSKLEEVKARIGQISDDGDWWVDKHSGWPICPGEFDTDEGYEDGFKASSRAVLEEDAGARIGVLAPPTVAVQYTSPEAITVNNVVNALSVAMGINLETQKEFIINGVIETIRATVESESDYKEKVKAAAHKGKALPSYREFFNTSLLYYTLGMFLIGVQTAIPSIKTRKTHPGCVRSFSGYPFDGQGDLSSLTYLACVAYDIRTSSEPWNVLKRMNSEKIQTRIKAVIDTQLVQLPEVIRKFAEKAEYLLSAPPTDIPVEHDISQWTDFLPPLMPFKIKQLTNISDEFKRGLVNDLRNGSERQREKLLVVESKIIQFSLAIQEKIQAIVQKHRALLHTANNEPYLENACCDSKENEPTIDYFADKDKDIFEYNAIVDKLTRILEDVKGHTQPILLTSNMHTKNVYPNVSTVFDEKTIYMAFIFYCKFKSLLPIPADLLPICTSKPENLNASDSIERIIQKLKEDGRNYTNEQFLKLIQLISRENIVRIELDNPVISCVAKLTSLLDAIYDENNDDELVEQSVRDLLSKAIDRFDLASETTTQEVKELNNFLVRNNQSMIQELKEFVQKNSGVTVSRNAIKKCIERISSLAEWNMDQSNRNEHAKISSDSMYSITHFYKTFIENFVGVFPNLILNKVDYDNVHIPKYYKFSSNHEHKLKTHVAQYYSKLKPFYGTKILHKVLSAVQASGRNVLKLANATPCFSSIRNGDQVLRGVIDERTSRDLFEYYLLRVLVRYIELADDETMFQSPTPVKTNYPDLFSTDFIDEANTRSNVAFLPEARVAGNKRELKQNVAELLVSYMDIFSTEKDIVDVTYEEIQDRVFKLKEREKDMVTDRLKALTDEARDADTMKKIAKLGEYSKGLQKGLTVLDKDFYDSEQAFRDEMEKAERNIRMKNKDATDENIDILVDELLEQRQAERDIERDAYDMSHLNEDYYDGNYDDYDHDGNTDYD